MMALADCAYRFYREGCAMRLEVSHLNPPSAQELADPEFIEEYYPDYRSSLADNEMARLDIMRRFLTRGMNGYFIRGDASFRQEQINAERVLQANMREPIFPNDMPQVKWRESE